MDNLELNIPIILDFSDYHEIRHMEDILNQIFYKKIKSEELGCNNSKYQAIFFFEKDKEYDKLVKDYAQNNEE